MENNKYSREAYDKEVAKLISVNPDGPKNYEMYITILMKLIETFLRSRRPGEDITEVLRELKFQDECVEDLAKVLTTNQEGLAENLHEMNHQNPLQNFEYRINLSLMESNQQPTVILRLNQQGEMKTVNLSLKQFHQLRLSTASALHAIENKKSTS